MALYKVMLPNDYFAVGDYVEDAGLGTVQKVLVRQEEGRLVSGDFVGLTFPLDGVRKCLFKILSRGFDDQGAWRETRRIEVH